jgi:hypothetical protein
VGLSTGRPDDARREERQDSSEGANVGTERQPHQLDASVGSQKTWKSTDKDYIDLWGGIRYGSDDQCYKVHMRRNERLFDRRAELGTESRALEMDPVLDGRTHGDYTRNDQMTCLDILWQIETPKYKEINRLGCDKHLH